MKEIFEKVDNYESMQNYPTCRESIYKMLSFSGTMLMDLCPLVNGLKQKKELFRLKRQVM